MLCIGLTKEDVMYIFIEYGVVVGNTQPAKAMYRSMMRYYCT